MKGRKVISHPIYHQRASNAFGPLIPSDFVAAPERSETIADSVSNRT